MKYYLKNKCYNTVREFSDWWELIEHFYNDNTSQLYKYTEGISHNDNDCYTSIVTKYCWDEVEQRNVFRQEEHSYLKALVVYDEFGTIVNKDDIKYGLRKFKPREEKRKSWGKKVIFEYRNGPVPGIHKYKNGSSRYRRPKWNKGYYAKVLEFEGSNEISFIRDWEYDVYRSRLNNRSWKDQSKKRKQWM